MQTDFDALADPTGEATAATLSGRSRAARSGPSCQPGVLSRAVRAALRAGRGTTASVMAGSLALGLAACSNDGGNGSNAAAGAAGAAGSSEGSVNSEGEVAEVQTKASFRIILDPVTGELIIDPDRIIFNAPIDRGAHQGLPDQPSGNAAYRARGAWSQPVSWPEIPIHAALTPDGRLMTYGTDAEGNQGARFNYSVWNPRTGDHMVLPNTTPTDIFCSAQVLLPGTGDLLLAGGDIRGRQVSDGAGGIRVNWGVNDVNRFQYRSNALVRDTPMRHARWYASLLTLPNGQVFTSGGVDDKGKGVANPEIYDPQQASWRTLSGITLYQSYPRTFLAPSGQIVAVVGNGVNVIDPSGSGTMRRAASLPTPTNWMMPAVEYDTGKLLVLRDDGAASLVDINGTTPTVREAAGVGGKRDWSSLTVLADGQVLMTGGGVANSGGANASLGASIWNPASGQWTAAATANKSREYHSLALLLPDGRVLAAGGGAPGPVIQLNGEVYTPPYLYDANGHLAQRPSILIAPPTLTPGPGRYTFMMGSGEPISKVTLVRTGSVTHAFNFDQSFLTVPHLQLANIVSVDIDRLSTELRPGFYMLFAFNARGVPSEAHIMRVEQRAGGA